MSLPELVQIDLEAVYNGKSTERLPCDLLHLNVGESEKRITDNALEFTPHPLCNP
jgi:hypothetical protein